MNQKAGKILLIGYGNPGRLDDGLGPALSEAFEQKRIPGLTVDSNYQLTVEDAAVIAEHKIVIFADASVNGPEPFSFYRVDSKPEMGFSSHSIEPEAVLGMAQDLFKAQTKGYVLGIRGYEFNVFAEQLSSLAQFNLQKAVEFLEGLLRKKNFSDYDKIT